MVELRIQEYEICIVPEIPGSEPMQFYTDVIHVT